MEKKLSIRGKTIRILYWAGRDIRNIVFWIAVLVNSLFLFWSSELWKYSKCDLFQGLDNAFTVGMAAQVVPIAVSVTSVMRFYDELQDGIYRVEVIRAGKLKFVFLKIMEILVSSAMVMIATLIIYTLGVYVYAGIHHLPITVEDSPTLNGQYDTHIYAEWIREGKGILVYFIKCIFMTVYGTVWAVLGTSLTVFISNKRVAVLFPYILKSLMELLGFYCAVKWGIGILILGNLMLTSGTAQMPFGGIIYEAGWLGFVLLLSMTIIYVGMERIYKKQG